MPPHGLRLKDDGPLSIAAGAIGILTAAAQFSSLLIKFSTPVSKAPRQARIITAELRDTTGILSHLNSFTDGLRISCQVCRKRKAKLLYMPSSRTPHCTRLVFSTAAGTQNRQVYVYSPVQVYQSLELQFLRPPQPRRRSTWLTETTSLASSN